MKSATPDLSDASIDELIEALNSHNRSFIGAVGEIPPGKHEKGEVVPISWACYSHLADGVPPTATLQAALELVKGAIRQCARMDANPGELARMLGIDGQGEDE